MPFFQRTANAIMVGRLTVYPRIRARWFRFERQPTYFCLTVAHPRKHAWWAFSAYWTR